MKEKIIKKITKMIATEVVSSGPYEWPPSCLFLTYQPIRPDQGDIQHNNSNAPKSKAEH
jgi:hypothetical protein